MKLKKDWFLPAVTTTKGASWQSMVQEIDMLDLKRIAVFLTGLLEVERKKIYSLLEKTSLKEIPFVHLKSDMRPEELDYFIHKWQTKVFNIHPQAEYPLQYDYAKYRHLIYIENVYDVFDEQELNSFAGICLDLSHLENDKHFNKGRYKNALDMAKKYKVGCNHISAIKEVAGPNWPGASAIRYDKHMYLNLREFNYVLHYPKECFSYCVALELENSLQEQLKAIDYLCAL